MKMLTEDEAVDLTQKLRLLISNYHPRKTVERKLKKILASFGIDKNGYHFCSLSETHGEKGTGKKMRALSIRLHTEPTSTELYVSVEQEDKKTT